MLKLLLLDQRRILEDLENFEPCHRYNNNNYNQPCGNQDMSKVQCFGCNGFGDYKRDCPKDPKSKKNTKKKEVNITFQKMKKLRNQRLKTTRTSIIKGFD